MHFLDHVCASPPAARTVEAVREAATTLSVPGPAGATALALAWLERRDRARRAAARLLAAPPAAVTLVESTTHGLGLVAAGLDLRSGDEVLIPDCEFLGLTALWQGQVRRGVRVRSVPSRGGAVAVPDVAAAVGPCTRAVVCSAVQEVSGAPTDLAGVADVAARVGALVLVDGIQEAGVLRTSPAPAGVDAYAAGGHKWLRNPFGLGLLWTSDRLRDRLRPPWQGYFALPEPAAGWESVLRDRTRTAHDLPGLRADGDALELGGTPNWLGAVGLDVALGDLFTSGADQVERRALRLADRLRAGLVRLGAAPLTPVGTRSPIVTFGLPGGEPAEQALHDRLRAAGVHVSLRGGAGVGGVRAGCHGHNTDDDVDALLDVVAGFPRT
ncbi:aminotransferase class V-fold PLP-dependent enzyme [Pseudonocardia nigra]|uniref:aminotransferase class V-fold PLP-dependent enzyme n=1 Tax=Pseudonocardia nigra TaxID=1921578 RepID=UPI001C5EE893|nr:aminotransferase class V-fold PLP-dependent enzyme [Pseudonocardia nigra]